MGGLWKKMPITCATYGVSVLAIAGIFFFSGYQSKHAILAALEHAHNPILASAMGSILMLVNFTAFLTAFYMTRSFAMTFLGSYRGHAHPHESPWAMTVPLIVLAILGAFGGLVLQTHAYSLEHYLANIIPLGQIAHHSESILEAIMHSWIGLLGLALGLVLYTQLKSLPAKIYNALYPIGNLFSHKYYLDEIYGSLIVRPLEGFAKFLWKIIDQGLIDGIVNGSAQFIDISGEVRQVTNTGQLRFYTLSIFAFTVFFVLFYLVL